MWGHMPPHAIFYIRHIDIISVNQWFKYFEMEEHVMDEVTMLRNKIDSLERENQRLREQQNSLLVMGAEQELYPGEIKDLILETLSESIKNNPSRSRRNDVIRDIIDHNDYQAIGKRKMNKLKDDLRKSWNGGMDRNLKRSLKEFGFSIRINGRNKHVVGTYYDDSRYQVTFPSTPSDWRSGLNIASTVSHVCM